MLKAVSYTHLDVYKRQAMGDDTAVSTVVLDAENGATLSKDVEKAYLDVLKQGTESYHCLLYTSYWQWRKE